LEKINQGAIYMYMVVAQMENVTVSNAVEISKPIQLPENEKFQQINLRNNVDIK